MKPSTYGRPVHERLSSANNATATSSATQPKDASAVWITVETADARVTFDGTDPTAASAPSLIFPIGVPPQLVLVRPAVPLRYCSTGAATASVLQLLWVT